MLNLPNITLCTLGGKDREYKNQKALDYSCLGITFGAVKNVIMDIKNIDEWNYAVIYKLWKHIETDYALLIHEDGFVVNPQSWSDIFMEYDYIGAPWPFPSDYYS